MRANYIITAGWAVAFAVIVAVDSAILVNPAFPTQFAFVVNILAVVGALAFTNWYSKHAGQAHA